MLIGHYQQQPANYKAFIPLPFPPQEGMTISPAIAAKHAEALYSLGKLDGIAQLLPDKNFFLLMFLRKEAASSSQIEGTQATMEDAIEAEVSPRSALPADVDDIIHYVKALNHGLELFKTIPLSVRLMTEMHRILMEGSRSTQNPYPGEFRRSQNWISGTTPSNALFVPPPPHEISRCLGDLEKFIHSKNDGYLPLIKAGLIHAQFETIHPFTDGNGRTGRLLITMFLWQEKLLESPILYLSDFFKKHQNLYYTRLQKYHSEPADIEGWLDFFLEGIRATATSAIEVAKEINQLREQDMAKLQKLGKASAETGIDLLRNLYQQPIVDVAKIQEWTGFTRAGAQKVIDRFIQMEILKEHNPDKTYSKTYEYNSYLKLFYAS